MSSLALLVVGMLALPVAAAPAPAPVDAASQEARVEAELSSLRTRFVSAPRAEVEAALDALWAESPSVAAAARGELWRAELALQDGDVEGARRRCESVRARFADGELGVLAVRDLTDATLAAGHWSEAIALVDGVASRAQQGSPLVAVELGEKRKLAVIARARFVGEVAAWTVYLAALAWYARRLAPWVAPRPRAHVPVETFYLAPLYLLLALGAWRRDAGVGLSMAWLGAGSLLLVTVAFAPSRSEPQEGQRAVESDAKPTTRARLLVDAAVMILGTSALAYIAVRRGGVVEMLWQTVTGGAEAG